MTKKVRSWDSAKHGQVGDGAGDSLRAGRTMLMCVPFEKKNERRWKEKKPDTVLKVALLGLVGLRWGDCCLITIVHYYFRGT